MSFQFGDVVRHCRSPYWKIGVVSAPREGTLVASDRVWAYWKRPHGEPGWSRIPLRAAKLDLIPHENPDPILAEFVAWRLTQ